MIEEFHGPTGKASFLNRNFFTNEYCNAEDLGITYTKGRRGNSWVMKIGDVRLTKLRGLKFHTQILDCPKKLRGINILEEYSCCGVKNCLFRVRRITNESKYLMHNDSHKIECHFHPNFRPPPPLDVVDNENEENEVVEQIPPIVLTGLDVLQLPIDPFEQNPITGGKREKPKNESIMQPLSKRLKIEEKEIDYFQNENEYLDQFKDVFDN